MADWRRRELTALACAGVVAGVVVGSLWLAAHNTASDGPCPSPYKKALDATKGLIGFKRNDSGNENDVPENAPHGCPGVDSDKAGQASACEGCPNRPLCASGQGIADNTEHLAQIANKLANVKHKILVLSGKGGVGKSTISTQIAWELQSRGHAVGLLDIDICGPSIPRMTGTQDQEVRSFGEGWLPVCVNSNFCVMSIGYLLPNQDGAVIWRGPKKNGLIRQFLTDIYWGDLDYLIIDTPPGTSDEHLSIVTLLGEAGVDGAVVVTTPQEISIQDVRKEINFCKQTKIEVLGVVENMTQSVFAALDPDAAKNMCVAMNVPYAGSLDLDPAVLKAGEQGKPIGVKKSRDQLAAALDKCLNRLVKISAAEA